MSNVDTSRPQTDTQDLGADPEQRQRREIESTRADVGRTLGRLEDRVSPTRIKERQADRMRSRWQDMREAVMGSDNGEGQDWRSRVDDVQAGVEHAPERVEEATRGNPLAAGMIAFGFGALAGSLVPASEPERRLASQLREEFEQPVRDELQDAGREIGDQLGDRTQAAVEEIRDTAKDAAQRTTDDTREAAERVRGDAQQLSDGQSDSVAPPSSGGQSAPRGPSPRSW